MSPQLEWVPSKKTKKIYKCWQGFTKKGRLLTLFWELYISTAIIENSTQVP